MRRSEFDWLKERALVHGEEYTPDLLPQCLEWTKEDYQDFIDELEYMREKERVYEE